MQNQPISPDVCEYLTLNGFERLHANITLQTVFVRNYKDAIILSGIHITYKQNIHDTSADALTVMNKWQTVKKYTGFDGQNIFNLMMLLHIMEVISIKDIHRQLQKTIRGEILRNVLGMSDHNVNIPA